MLRTLTIVCGLLLACAASWGQSLLPSAGTIDVIGGDAQDHAWVSVPVRDDTAVLLHLPPGTGRGGVGAVNLATKLIKQPDAIAAHGRDAYMCFAAERNGDQTLRRRVLSISARPIEGTTQWTYTGAQRLEMLPSLDGDAELRGFIATSSGLHALLLRDEPTLLTLSGREWVEVPLPDELSDNVRLVRMDDDLVIIDRAEPARIWRGAQGRAWERASELETAVGDLPATLPIVGVNAMLAWLEQAPSGDLLVVAAGPNARFEFGQAATPNEDVAFFTNGGTPSVVILTRRRQDQASVGEMHLRRLSIGSGAVLNEATMKIAGPVSGSQFVLVVLMLAGVLMMVLTFVFWPEQAARPRLPEHLMIATSSRRLVAASIDLAIGVIPAALIVGVPIRDVVLPGLSDDPLGALNGVVLAIAIACAQSAIMEALVHRSIGKALMGLQVHGIAGDTITPLRPWEALVRNLVRWWLAPAALAGLCRSWRHVGDVAARSVVTQHAEAEEEEA